jgi:hypothetical protein
MLVLRREQIDILAQGPWGVFERRLVEYLRRFFPALCASLGEERLALVVHEGRQRAQGHGFTSERDLSKYLSLICTFGPDFDIALPWAAEILALNRGPSKKMERLFAVALERAHDAAGPAGLGAEARQEKPQ